MRDFQDISIDQLAAVSGGQTAQPKSHEDVIGAVGGALAGAAYRMTRPQPQPAPASTMPQLSPIRPGMSGLAIRERLPAVP